MRKKFTILTAALALLAMLAVPKGGWGQTTTLVSGSGSSGYAVPDGWTTSGTVEGGQYLKFDDGTITSPQFEPHNELSFSYSVATFGSGTNHPLTIRILNASTNAVILEQTTVTPTSSSYTSPESPLSLGDVTVAFKIQMYGPTGKGVRLRNYSVTGTPAGDIPTTYTVTYNGNGNTSGDVPVDNNEYDEENNTVTVLGNTGGLAKTGHTFNGWNTAANGSGTSYAADDQFTISANTTLYAQWSPNKYSYTLNVTGTEHPEEAVGIYVDNQTGWESGGQIEYGQQVTVSVSPLSGYTYTTTVTYGDNVNVPVVNDMFTMPAGDVAITVVLTPCVIWDLTTASYSSASTTSVTWSSDYVIMTNDKGDSQTNANSYLGGGDYTHTRFYSSQVLSFTPVLGYTIKSIEITAVNNYVAGFIENTWTNATIKNSGTKITVTPNNGNNPCSVVISKACRATSVTVNYEVSTLEPHDITNSINMVNGTVVASHSSAVEGTIVTLTVYPAAGYHLENVGYIDVVLSATPGTSVAITQVNDGTFTFTMPDEDVTVVALFTEYSGTYYTLVNSADDLIPGRHYIIASSKNAGAAYAMGAQNSGGYREQVAVNVVGNFIYGTPTGLREVVLSGDNTNLWTLYDDGTDAASQGYLYAGTSNALRCRTDNTSNDNGKWTISITEGVATIVSQISGTDVSNTIKYNAGSSRFSCYTPSSGMSLVYLFMKADETDYELYSNTSYNNLTIGELDIYTVHSPAVLNVTTLSNEGDHENLIIEDGGQLFASSQVAATVQKNIVAHGATPAAGGWNFIASPVAQNLTSNVLTGSGADLYYYEEANHMWRNYKINDNLDGFDFANGKGYLYANPANTTLSFAGLQRPSNESVTVPADNLSCAADVLTGFNLVGNPFPCKATLNRDYYAVNGSGLEAKTAEVVLDPCAGAMVQVSAENKVVTFTRVEPTTQQTSQPNQLQMTVAQQVMSRGTATSMVNDNAIINFNAGSRLEKFAFNADAAKLYIPQNGKDYAIVSAEGQGEMPVNFRANTDGQYTLTVNPEGVEMNYLHLIDNMTGNDVDLLATPSYTFNATTRDYESRFRLVFAANNENGVSAGSTTFAYFSNGNLVVNNEGNATLQVVDVMGRIVKSESINGSASINVNAAPGVYTLRLVNGNEVKTQKVVVR